MAPQSLMLAHSSGVFCGFSGLGAFDRQANLSGRGLQNTSTIALVSRAIPAQQRGLPMVLGSGPVSEVTPQPPGGPKNLGRFRSGCHPRRSARLGAFGGNVGRPILKEPKGREPLWNVCHPGSICPKIGPEAVGTGRLAATPSGFNQAPNRKRRWTRPATPDCGQPGKRKRQGCCGDARSQARPRLSTVTSRPTPRGRWATRKVAVTICSRNPKMP